MNILIKLSSFVLFFIIPIFSSPIVFPEGNKKNSSINSCYKKDTSRFILESFHFESPSNFPDAYITQFAREQALNRTSQLRCLKKIQLSKEEKQEMIKSYMFFRQRELEALEIYSNFFSSFEKKNLYAPGELQRLNEYLKTKDELYKILDLKTKDILFNNEDLSEDFFVSIYQSLLRLQYDILANLSTKLRNEVLKKINSI